MEDWEDDGPEFQRVTALASEREIERYGIADGMYRRAIDPAYAHEPAYLAGHRIGLRLPAESADLP